MKKVIWGVLSTAKIGRERVLPGMLKSSLLEIRAIASRDEARGRAAADAGSPGSRSSTCSSTPAAISSRSSTER